VSLYRDPPGDGVVICMDEMGPLATIPRGGRSWGKKPARRSDRYHRSQTIQLLAAFAPHTGHGVGCPNTCKTGEAVWAFLQGTVLPQFGGDRKIYLIWDNFSAHKRALNLWTPKPTNIEFFWTPTNASWLNLIEPWFLVLEKTALHNTDLKTTAAIAENLAQGIDYLNEHPRPYRWKKAIGYRS
jgi:DDE superfamily endonuclease